MKHRSDLPTNADVVVVGGGIMGLAIAFHYARLAPGKRIVVLEASYLCSGASGRNGGGVRAQWSSATNVALMRESLEICRDFAVEMGINVWFRPGGYLFLARSSDRAAQLEASVEVQRGEGLRTRLIGRRETARLVPELRVDDLELASYNPGDGVVFPWPFVWGYANACDRLGVGIFAFSPVEGIESDGRRVRAVVSGGHRIETNEVIVAAGAWSPELTAMVGIELPSKPHRHEICSTEPLKPFLQPLVAELATGLYFSQSMRGEIVGGISNPDVPEGLNQESSLAFLKRYGRALTSTMPRLGAVKVLRQWAGCYDITPDGNPIVGRVDALEGLILASGFMGHGFMMAPVMSKRLVEHLLKGSHEALFHRWSLERFARGQLLEESMILG